MSFISIGKYKFQGTNRRELLELKKEIFQDNIYFINSSLGTPHSSPSIIDAGAHVGLSVLYFKQQWPDSKVVAIEPQPHTAALLRSNIWENQLKDVEIIEKALSGTEGTADFYFDLSDDRWFSTASFQSGAWDQTQTYHSIKVDTILLDSLLTQTVDLLKLDIEGAEISVLQRAQLLHHINHAIVELHPPHQPEDIVKIFKKSHDVSLVKHHYGLKLCYVTRKK